MGKSSDWMLDLDFNLFECTSDFMLNDPLGLPLCIGGLRWKRGGTLRITTQGLCGAICFFKCTNLYMRYSSENDVH